MNKAKFAVFALLSFALITTTGCGSKKKSKGPAPSEGAWEAAFNNSVYVADTAAIEDMENDVKPDDAKPFIRLLNKAEITPAFETETYNFTYDYKYKVTVNGEEKKPEDYIEDTFENPNMNLTALQFKNWPEGDDTASYPRFTVEAIAKCNGHKQSKFYTMVLYPATYHFKKMSLEEIYQKHESLNALKWMRAHKKDNVDMFVPDGEPTPEYPDSTYYNIETQGKLIYVTEDSNWGLIQDGDRYLQVYRLDSLPIFKIAKDIVLGQKIWLKCLVGFGYGNVQLSYVKSLLPVKDGDSAHPVQEPTAMKSFNESTFSNVEWWNHPVFNEVGTVSGKIKDGKVYTNSSGKRSSAVSPSSVQTNKTRYEFDIIVGSTTVIVAFDYHACSGVEKYSYDQNITPRYDEFLKGLTEGADITISGSIRWQNANSKCNDEHAIGQTGVWTIIPYQHSHLG